MPMVEKLLRVTGSLLVHLIEKTHGIFWAHGKSVASLLRHSRVSSGTVAKARLLQSKIYKQ